MATPKWQSRRAARYAGVGQPVAVEPVLLANGADDAGRQPGCGLLDRLGRHCVRPVELHVDDRIDDLLKAGTIL